MHDLDRTLMEMEASMDEFESGDFEEESGDYEFEAGDYELEAGDYELEASDYEFEGRDDEFETGDYEMETGDYELETGDGEFEFGQDPELESGYGREEQEFELDMETGGEGEAVFDEVEEMELAGTLLEITDEQELDYFITGLLRKAGKAAGRFLGSPEGMALAGVLKKVARKAVPALGAALGNLAMPGVGGAAGAQVANRIFGLELEGMSRQDQEFEVARRFVRLAASAAQDVAQGTGGESPAHSAKNAVVRAAELYAPGLAGGGSRYGGRSTYGTRQSRYWNPLAGGGAWSGGNGGGGWSGAQSGRWVRRGRRIVLYGF